MEKKPFTKVYLVWYKVRRMAYTMRLEFTNNGQLAELTIYCITYLLKTKRSSNLAENCKYEASSEDRSHS